VKAMRPCLYTSGLHSYRGYLKFGVVLKTLVRISHDLDEMQV